MVSQVSDRNNHLAFAGGVAIKTNAKARET